MHRAHIKTFVANLLTEKKDTLARNSIRIIFATLRVMLSAAVEDGLTLANPAFGVGRKMKLGRAARISDAEDGKVKPFASYEELARFLETARVLEPMYYPAFLTMALAALRIGECLGLKWADLDVDRREIHVARTLAAPKKASRSTKASTRRSLSRPATGRKLESMRRGDGGEISPFVFYARQRLTI